MTVKTTLNATTSKLASCIDCAWDYEGGKAIEEAKSHTRIMRHKTSVQVVKAYHYEPHPMDERK